MPVLDVLYKLGDEIASLMGSCEDELTVESWHGYWVGLCTQAITLPADRHPAVVANMATALKIAYRAILAPTAEQGE
jgi:hypothetical protein